MTDDLQDIRRRLDVLEKIVQRRLPSAANSSRVLRPSYVDI